MNDNPVEIIKITKVNANGINETNDKVAVEEPLGIQLEYSSTTGRMLKNIAVTMRTPGNDEELAVGFLFTEGVFQNINDIAEVKRLNTDVNLIRVVLNQNVIPKLSNVSRNFYTTSSCGICGKASIEAIHTVSQFEGTEDNIQINAIELFQLQIKIKEQQKVFEDTGGIHASALFSIEGNFMMLREDVGRHNALDKVIGCSFMNNQLPLSKNILFLSGRASFELVQKAVMSGIKIIAAVGAPSNLAVEVAKENDITLIGFLREDKFNIYAGKQRIKTTYQPTS